MEIRYQAKEPYDDEEKKQEEEEDAKKDGEGEEKKEKPDSEEVKLSINFSIIIKNKSGEGMLFECTTKNSKLSVKRSTYSKKIYDMLKKENIRNPLYQSPEYLNIDDKMERYFLEYLESIGISDKLIAYIECSALDKEQQLYIGWLSDLNQFINDS